MNPRSLVRVDAPGGSGSHVVVDLECGGTVRALALRGQGESAATHLLVDPEARECDTAWFAGRLLVPFADRLVGARYEWQGRRYQLQPNDSNGLDAIHGFLYRTPMHLLETTPGVLIAETHLASRPGYRWSLTVRVTYRVAATAASVQIAVTNEGPGIAPITIGWHPYFAGAEIPIDSAELAVDGERFAEVDELMRPTGRLVPVGSTRFDYRSARAVGGEEIDIALFGGSPGAAPRATLTHGGRRIVVAGSGAFRAMQLFVPPDRRSIALEPVSAPAEAFHQPTLGDVAVPEGETLAGEARVEVL